ncbi:unnamed protein product [Durusdinium trenchii]|uniref:Ricin B lectin domain-containing protein n=1 Tax=Durusdinium trenchii TaxID=1381693 RepID=A0ABP0PFR1_9DINO
MTSYEGPLRWAGDGSKCLDVQGGQPVVGAQVGLWACRAEHPNQQFAWNSSDGRIRWRRHPSLCLGSPGGGTCSLASCGTSVGQLISSGDFKAICLGGWRCLKIEAIGDFALDGTPIQVVQMTARERAAPSLARLFVADASCSGEAFCGPLADCYESCRLSGEFNQACWQSSCCPSASKPHFNDSSFNYYVCGFTQNACMDKCNSRFQSRRCGGDGKTYCPPLANCYEACRLNKHVSACRSLPCCPKDVDSFNQSMDDFYRCEHSLNSCLKGCNEAHDAYRYCDGRSYCPQLAGCYQECHQMGLAPKLCSSHSSCCPAFRQGDRGATGYADSALGYYTCDDGVACLERCNGRFAFEEPNSLQNRHIPRPDVLRIIATLQAKDDPPPGSSPLASAILVLSVLLILVAGFFALVQRRKQIPAWTGPIGRVLHRQRLDFLRVEDEEGTLFQRLEQSPTEELAPHFETAEAPPEEEATAQRIAPDAAPEAPSAAGDRRSLPQTDPTEQAEEALPAATAETAEQDCLPSA